MEQFNYFINRLFVQMYDILHKIKTHREDVSLFILDLFNMEGGYVI